MVGLSFTSPKNNLIFARSRNLFTALKKIAPKNILITNLILAEVQPI